MRFIKAWWMTLGMFSIVPVPPVWDEKAKPWVIPMLPLVGLVPGVLAFGIAWLAGWIGLSDLLSAVLVLLAWHLATGFIHDDGLMDTSDALFSRADREKRLAILKDPHVGSFAVIALLSVLLIQLAAFDSILDQKTSWWLWLILPVLSRACASLAVLLTPTVLTNGYASQFRSARLAPVAGFPLIVLITLPLLSFFTAGWSGLLPALVLLAAAGVTWLALHRSFGGISGDLAGFILVISETAALLAWAIQPEVWMR